MSVGVCIINRNGIALAADSAGTYPGNKMFYNSMNKVFSLSKKYVYGAITYGASSMYFDPFHRSPLRITPPHEEDGLPSSQKFPKVFFQKILTFFFCSDIMMVSEHLTTGH